MFRWPQARHSPGGSKGLPKRNQPWWVGFDEGSVTRVLTSDYAQLISWLNQSAKNLGLRTGRGCDLQFGPQSVLPDGIAYEHWIAQTGVVPTRDNLHDRINALVWLTYPLTKAALNREQAQVIETQTDVSRRGPVRDAATLWDENLSMLIDSSDDQLLQDLLAKADWHRLFVTHRQRWADTWQIRCFGHALLEKLMAPYKAITSHTIVLLRPSLTVIDRDEIDQMLSQRISSSLAPSLFRPLPVMGIPGWDAAQDDPMFYRDVSVFRPLRHST